MKLKQTKLIETPAGAHNILSRRVAQVAHSYPCQPAGVCVNGEGRSRCITHIPRCSKN